MSTRRKFIAAAVTAGTAFGVFAAAAPASAVVITTCPATIANFTFAAGRGGVATGTNLHTLRETSTACGYTATTYSVFTPGQGTTVSRNVRVQIVKNFNYPILT